MINGRKDGKATEDVLPVPTADILPDFDQISDSVNLFSNALSEGMGQS